MTVYSPGNLYPYPEHVEWKSGHAKFQGVTELALPKGLGVDTVELFQETWKNFSLGLATLELRTEAALPPNSFRLAGGAPVPLPAGARTALEIGEEGAFGVGASERDLKHAWFSLLQVMVCGRGASAGSVLLPALSLRDRPKLGFRGLHLCVFPETSLEFIGNMVDLAAFLKYSHVVIEFWGMLKYDCMKELAWPQAYTKEQVRPLLAKARRLGVEPIPMFNHWGHAAACRSNGGKHVVLDQNPSLEPLFEPDGWTWCLTNPDSLALLREVRAELCDLFGKTGYFHLGCDEAYSHGSCPECAKHDSPRLWADYLNAVNDDLKRRGTRPIIWGDALLEEGKWPDYIALSRGDQRTHEALDLLSKDFVINDWQYSITDKGRADTLKHFRAHGFDVITAPWHDVANIEALADMAAGQHSLGMMLTTWHTLPTTIGSVIHAAECMWGGQVAVRRGGNSHTSMASFIRKLRGTPAAYLDAGWRAHDVDEH